ncbi:hypothetical protein Amme3_00098 [Pseudomonas phage vB_PpuM-Amme-3]|uniref:Uncharacterized protein n=1 Tax=Pseudomonas phage vB_PpuM-Amme-3 TaxID=3132617 RepID=A0AAX4MXF2_9CAUD
MAKATKIQAVTEVVVKVPEGVQLTLTIEEARALKGLLGEVIAEAPTAQIYMALDDIKITKSHDVYMSGSRVGPLHLKKV